ncbi:uncharacterized protein PHALS_14727 [Plasmopara halstedii]|uniref:Uncharacterized protein n=1 Tax=Plasmopara halstedii TaxID=4781 RepID=A0A0P1A583_PLAHL|nr:uncharacterized protein PHALS_14727 [Plasmopara halstedii]CEG35149.1 hypothetical protein PHALS_14727 [Plasmopara halstedii]|eukprot:XP_024571518.1 hypothetical protein PHALS_14727 [Plasmopara halstedii]
MELKFEMKHIFIIFLSFFVNLNINATYLSANPDKPVLLCFLHLVPTSVMEYPCTLQTIG